MPDTLDGLLASPSPVPGGSGELFHLSVPQSPGLQNGAIMVMKLL